MSRLGNALCQFLSPLLRHVPFGQFHTPQRPRFPEFALPVLAVLTRQADAGRLAGHVPLDYLLLPVVIAALLFNYAYSLFELTWSFSIWLESVAILPQLFMLQRTGEAETITTHYLAALGLYRGLYIPNWMYRGCSFLLSISPSLLY